MGDLMTTPAPQVGRAPRGRAQHETLIGSTPRAEASKILPSRLRTRACGLSSRAPVPKVVPAAIKARAVALLVELENAEQAAKRLNAEYPGVAVSAQSIRNWAVGLKVKIPRGRRPGIVEAKPRAKQTKPHVDVDPDLREKAEAALGEEGSLRKAAAVLGISYERVRQLTGEK